MKQFLATFALLILSSSALAATGVSKGDAQDKVIFDSLNAPILALPSPAPYSAMSKQVGRLNCVHLTDTNAKVETYDCNLDQKGIETLEMRQCLKNGVACESSLFPCCDDNCMPQANGSGVNTCGGL